MTHPDLITRYKEILEDVLKHRSDGSLTDEEEAKFAEERDELWRQLSADEQEELEDWIDARVNGDDE